MKNSLFFILILVVAVACTKDNVKGSGTVKMETRNLTNFQAVEISGASNAYIQQNNSYGVAVKAYENLLPHFETKVAGQKLMAGYKAKTNVKNDNAELYVDVPFLNSVTTSGSGSLYLEGSFTSQNFMATTSGSGNIDLPMGNVENLVVKTTGSGKVNGFDFIARNADVTINGNGHVQVQVSGKLNVQITGSGNVYYKGNPANISSQITGSGKIIKH
ncbi:MAG: DUF2807 domain-containing protein [Niabella sp.]|nr:MAG: DUF2807 domain-containing protein [Niabella sp.]